MANNCRCFGDTNNTHRCPIALLYPAGIGGHPLKYFTIDAIVELDVIALPGSQKSKGQFVQGEVRLVGEHKNRIVLTTVVDRINFL